MNPSDLTPAAGGASHAVLQLGLALVAVLGLIFLLQRVARRYGAGFAGGGDERIEILTQRAIGPRASLAVVRVMGRTLLVGISPQGISPVSDLGSATMPEPRESSSRTRKKGIAAKSKSAVARSEAPVATRPSFLEALRLSFARTFKSERNVSAPSTPKPASTLAAVESLPEPPVKATRAPASIAHPPLAPFEDELEARIQSLKDRYPALWEVESAGSVH